MIRISILGLGAMGSRLATRFLAAGYSVTVYNRTPERAAALQKQGALFAQTPRAAVADADLVISMVRDADASRELWLHADTGAIHGLGAGAIAIESSTLPPWWVLELAAAIGLRGAAFLEAPVLGTRPQAESGQLIYLVGGRTDDLARVAEVLKVVARAIHHLGPIGTAAAMKLAVNAQYSAQVAIWAETLVVLAGAGIETAQAVEVLNTLPTTSPALQIGGALMAAAQYMPLFPIDLVQKDLGYARTLAQELGIPTPTLDAVYGLYADANARGYGNDNIVGVKQVIDASVLSHKPH